MTPLPPLPHLPVIREDYCSQKMTDDIIDLLWQYDDNKEMERDPDLELDRLVRFATVDNNCFSDRLDEFEATMLYVNRSMRKLIAVPDTSLGYVDLSFELDRRICASVDPETKNLIMPKILSKKLESVKELPLLDKTGILSGLFIECPYETAMDVTTHFYENDYDSCFFIAEATRRNVFPRPILERDRLKMEENMAKSYLSVTGQALDSCNILDKLLTALTCRVNSVVL